MADIRPWDKKLSDLGMFLDNLKGACKRASTVDSDHIPEGIKVKVYSTREDMYPIIETGEEVRNISFTNGLGKIYFIGLSEGGRVVVRDERKRGPVLVPQGRFSHIRIPAQNFGEKAEARIGYYE